MALTNEQAAELALHFEAGWGQIDDSLGSGRTSGPNDLYGMTGDPYLEGYELVDAEYIQNCDGVKVLKCIAVKDSEGNIYVHFNGTGDGNWGYNSSVYTGEDSPVQIESTKFLNDVVRTRAGEDAEVYVSGHSQGGCTAQYATLFADEDVGRRITHTTSLDGPGISTDALERLQQNPEYYEQQRQKLYAFNGYMDFVSPLGQEQVVPEDHVYMVHTSDEGFWQYCWDEKKDGPHPSDPGNRAHGPQYMLGRNGKLGKYVPYLDAHNGESSFRKLILEINSQIRTLGQEDQALVALCAMNLAEHFLGKRGKNVQGEPLSEEDFAKFKELMLPILLDILRNHPELLNDAIRDLGLDPNMEAVIVDYLEHLEGMSPAHQEEALRTLLGAVHIGEDGKPTFNLGELLTNPNPGTTLAILELLYSLLGTEEGRALISEIIGSIDKLALLNDTLCKILPGYQAVSDRVAAFLKEKGFDGKSVIDYIKADPAHNTLALIGFVVSDFEALMGLVKMAGTIATIIKFMPLIITLLKFVGPILLAAVAIYVAFLVVQLVVDFIVTHWEEIMEKINAAIEWVEEMAKRICDYITGKIAAAIEATIQTAKFCYDQAKRFAREAYEKVVSFCDYAKQQIRAGISYLNDIAHTVVRTVTGAVQTAVTIYMQRLQDAVERMDRVAGRVQAMDRRLDTLYGWLCRSSVEQGEGIFVTLANLYRLSWADLNVDEGDRIRRMANNLSSLNEGYKTVEKWVATQL